MTIPVHLHFQFHLRFHSKWQCTIKFIVPFKAYKLIEEASKPQRNYLTLLIKSSVERTKNCYEKNVSMHYLAARGTFSWKSSPAADIRSSNTNLKTENVVQFTCYRTFCLKENNNVHVVLTLVIVNNTESSNCFIVNQRFHREFYKR